MKAALVVLALAACCAAGSSSADDGSAANRAAEPPVYLFSTFKEPEQDGLRFAFSFEGYHWTNVPGLFLKAAVGDKIMRDPSLLRGPDGTFHLVWTTAWRGGNGFGYARSRDLVHWSDQKLLPVMAHEPTAVNVWAPELFYDDGSWSNRRGNEPQTEKNQSEPPHVGSYVICWASTIPGRFADYLEPPTNNHRMYFTTTRDFESFTPTKLFYDPDFSVIDCQILKDGARYVLLLKDNSRPQRNIRVAFGDTPLGPWQNVSAPFTERFTEGPSALRIGEDWIIYYESYQAKHYSAAKTRDFRTFTDVTGEMVFPEGLKHGTALRVSRADLERLLKSGAGP